MLFIPTKYHTKIMLTRHHKVVVANPKLAMSNVECIRGPTDLDIRSTKFDMLTLKNRLITPTACHMKRGSESPFQN